jgi:hypothetical protein
VEKKGLEGCFIHWSRALNEEAADFRIELNEIEGVYRGKMFHCPSKGMLLSLKHMEPYKDYCDQCLALCKPVLEKFGYNYGKIIPGPEDAICTSTIKINKIKSFSYY